MLSTNANVFFRQADGCRRCGRILRHVDISYQRRPHHLRLSEREIIPGKTQVETEVFQGDGQRQRLGQQ